MNKTHLDVDLLIIGWGKAGKTLAASYAAAGHRVAVAEQFRALHGGSCINIACVPTKAILHSADNGSGADWFAESRARRDSLIDTLNHANHEMIAGQDTAMILDGRARFTGPHEVAVTAGEETVTVTAPKIVINTGSVPVIPEIDGLDPAEIPATADYATGTVDQAVFHDSTSIQHVDPLPDSLLIVDAGPIGLEFASMFSGFGSRVTLLNRNDALLPDLDEGMGEEVAAALTDRGVDIVTGELTRVARTDDGVTATLADDTELKVSAVLFATGRAPATEDLGLEEAGIPVTDRGAVKVDEVLRTPVDGVWAAGDVAGGPQFTYLSYDDHRIIAPQLDGGTAPHGTDSRARCPPPRSSPRRCPRSASPAGR